MSRFPTTQWGLVVAAGGAGQKPDRDALESLCKAYWYPVYVFARTSGCSADEAGDLTQGFFVHLIEHGVLRVADPDRGTFRAFLRAAFDHYAANERRKAHALKRRPPDTPIPLDREAAEACFASRRNEGEGPEAAFEKHWARALLARALARLEKEMADTGDERKFRRLSPFLTGTDDGSGYLRVGEELDLSEAATKVAVHRLRKRFGAVLREEVANTVGTSEGVDEELRHVLAVLGG